MNNWLSSAGHVCPTNIYRVNDRYYRDISLFKFHPFGSMLPPSAFGLAVYFNKFPGILLISRRRVPSLSPLDKSLRWVFYYRTEASLETLDTDGKRSKLIINKMSAPRRTETNKSIV
jgi:hypothetical protein